MAAITFTPTLPLVPRKAPHVLTIAGSDSGGGAGIQADLKTIEAFGCYGSSVLTGLTAQNTKGVQAVHAVPTDFVIKQLQSVVEDEAPVAIKLGMLTSATTIRALAQYLPTIEKAIVVLDPVMISTSGHYLLPDDAVEALDDLFPFVTVLTPNIPEAIRLAGFKGEVGGLEDMLKLAKDTQAKTAAKTVLLKGGHAVISRDEVLRYKGQYEIVWEEGDDEDDTVEVLSEYKSLTQVGAERDYVVDILVTGTEVVALFVGKKVISSSTHGTGCTLSSAIASSYAIRKGNDVPAGGDVKILKRAISYTQSAIASAFPFGHGHGPLNHAHLSTRRALPPPTRHNPHPFLTHLIQSNLPLWKSYVRHPFVVQLGNGSLPRECFEHYIKQDYHYLRHYARAHALGAYKASSFTDITAFSEIALHIARESEMHVSYCAQFGISREDLMAAPESAPCAAYARYVIDIGTQGDILDLYMAVASCLVGYGEVGLWLKKQVKEEKAVLEGNLYRRWMEDYSGPEFLTAVHKGIENLERRIAQNPPSEEHLARLTSIWHECVRLESRFWDMGLYKLL